MKYEPIKELSREDVDSIIERNDPSELLYVPVSVSLHSEDWKYAQDICISLSSHPDETVRGNALLGFGHIARIHGELEREKIERLVLDGFKDESRYVQGHADDAFEDINHFLKWDLKKETN